MDRELREQLEIMNANLTAIVRNQAMIYAELKEIEDKLPEEEKGFREINCGLNVDQL